MNLSPNLNSNLNIKQLNDFISHQNHTQSSPVRVTDSIFNSKFSKKASLDLQFLDAQIINDSPTINSFEFLEPPLSSLSVVKPLL